MMLRYKKGFNNASNEDKSPLIDAFNKIWSFWNCGLRVLLWVRVATE